MTPCYTSILSVGKPLTLCAVRYVINVLVLLAILPRSFIAVASIKRVRLTHLKLKKLSAFPPRHTAAAE